MTTPDELSRRVYELEKYRPVASDVQTISPDYSRIQTPLMWGGVWQGPGLDLKLRSFATIAAECVNGWDFGLQDQIRVGLTMGMSPRQIKGIFIQLLFYAGIPATVHGLLQAQTVINERDDWKAADVPVEADWLETLEAKLERGSEIRRNLWGEQANREVESSLAQRLAPEASNIVDAYNYGEVWAREDLAPKERMVCVLAALMARGHWQQLRRHVRYALNMGFNRREICEVFSQAGWYRGWPHVEDALEQAQQVFTEANA
ncbi:MAG: carboxymuconolactone decarboxylase family protein [Chloroflexota bacterium]|nr:carboxymuconolactone decarboxylase family protein [Chloroflexota bacterium]MDE2684632.1 carboxymuconolactone decarboxylase family protein [Chloroflexota bacterium]